ncbi:MAG: hypothetical protein PHC88_06060 [Terrimicrobiaceae bacterium]|nr:hypothetical protein [Terrimicrobiaceae bacterium]
MACRLLLGNVAAFVFPFLASAASLPEFAALNAAFGVPVWADDNLWDDSDIDVARRLQWQPESSTNDDSSFRRYAGANERVLGARPFSLALHGKGGNADEISMVFANKGDVGASENYRLGMDYKKQIAADTRTIRETLTRALGPAKAAQFGQGARTRERVERWDWNGHAILLAAPRGEYVAVRIVPTATADGEDSGRVTELDLREKLKARVVRRPNGDVVLKDIPMVDQGPKGYCVPATWERALRYLGIPADMYVLAMAGQVELGGGMTSDAMMAGANDIVVRNGRRMVTTGGRLTTRAVASFINAGLPIIWDMLLVRELEVNITYRTMYRLNVSDWDDYRQMLKPWRKSATRIRTNENDAHMCMIIGYNFSTGEIAISDSWGPEFAERWITEEEANAISGGRFTVVTW